MNKYESFVGKVLDGRYKILELVGMGGMACVLKAQDIVMNRIVAIKILNDEYNGNEAAEARFIDESKAVAMLSHKNIVSVYDVAIYPDIKYIVMEFLEGITLREYLDNKGALPWKEACIYILQILRALEHAHSKGIVHRDIKPQNVMLSKSGDIKVTDFGIAKLPNEPAAQKNEKAIGTVYYISPEQACGKETGYYSDIYSVGIMLYEAVTGTLPFTAETPVEVAMMQVNDEPINPRDIVLSVPVGVSQIILKAMEKSPADRFTSAHTMVKAIEWVLRNPDVIFSMSASTSGEEGPVGRTSVVSIDMIDTSEITPYGEDEIADSLGKKRRGKSKSDESDETQRKSKKKKKINRSMFPVIAGVTFAFIIVAIVLGATIGINLLNDIFSVEQPDDIVFPDITGKLYGAELEAKLLNKEYGAKFVIDETIEINDDNIPNNTIISTDPPPRHVSKPDESGVMHFNSITINKSEKVIVPQVVGYAKTQAQTLLANLGLNVEFNDDAGNGHGMFFDNQVTRTIPAGGEECKVGDTVTISIFVRGEITSTDFMPNCIGMTREDALKFAQTFAHYKVTFVDQPTVGGDGRVILQSINEGTISAIDTEVILTVATEILMFPDVTGMTHSEAITALNDIVMVRDVFYYTASTALRDTILNIGKTQTDVFRCCSALDEVGCVSEINMTEGIVVFQSILANQPNTDKQPIDLIVVNFVETPIEPVNP